MQHRLCRLSETLRLALVDPQGIYGMNFDFMPELHWTYGYSYAYGLFLGVVLLSVLLMWYMGLIKVGPGGGGG